MTAGMFVATRPAFGDVPPPPDVKVVNYSFAVKGFPAGTDRVLFAYPCGERSGGAPVDEHRKLEDGVTVNVGRRGGNCTIYSANKGVYEAWLKDYKPTMTARDPALEKLAGDSVKCAGGPTPTFTVGKNDPRTAIHQTLTVQALDATTCTLNAEPIASGTNGDSSGTNASSESKSKSSGCSFAPAPTASTSSGPFAAALALAVGVVLSRRRTSRGPHASRQRWTA